MSRYLVGALLGLEVPDTRDMGPLELDQSLGSCCLEGKDKKQLLLVIDLCLGTMPNALCRLKKANTDLFK